jgi:hypothetical protein
MIYYRHGQEPTEEQIGKAITEHFSVIKGAIK